MAALAPAFMPGPTWWGPEPLMWETPVSWESPAPERSAMDFPPKVTEKMAQVRQIINDLGLAHGLELLAQETELELVLLRAGLRLKAGDLAGAQADYEKVLNSKNMTAPRALALAGYKTVLRRRIAAGEKNLYGPLVKMLKEEWLNEEALNLLPNLLTDKEISSDVKSFLKKQEPIMALRLGLYHRAAELWASPADRSEWQWLAQTAYRQGDFEKAAGIRETLALKMSVKKGRMEELRAAFDILAKGGLYKKAADFSLKYPDLKKTADYDWRLGLASLAAGQLKEAQAHFEAVLQNNKDKKRHPGANYYLGRVLEKAGRADEARAAYEKAAQSSMNYYRVLALGRLDASRSNLDFLWPGILNPGPSGRDRDSLGYYLWISEKGFTDDKLEDAAAALEQFDIILAEGKGRADKALNAELKKLLAGRDWSGVLQLVRHHDAEIRVPSAEAKSIWLPLAASLAARSGDYRLALSLLSAVPTVRPEAVGRWSHPLIYNRDILTAQRDYGLSPALVLALIRTESAYQFDIMSASNARGLMQLLPATAGKVANSLGQSLPGAVDLFNPSLNIKYGTWYLKALVSGFENESLALAGYNGGPYNIKSMIEAKKGMPLDVFIDSLPFEETANYVKRITVARYIYEKNYLGQANSPDLTAPVTSPNDTLPSF